MFPFRAQTSSKVFVKKLPPISHAEHIPSTIWLLQAERRSEADRLLYANEFTANCPHRFFLWICSWWGNFEGTLLDDSYLLIEALYLNMLRLWKVSGEELACMTLEDLGDEGTVRVLKRYLRVRHSFPVSLQQLLHNGSRLEDDEILVCPMDIQVVLSQASSIPEVTIAAEFFGYAALEGDSQVVRMLIDAGADINMRELTLRRTAITVASSRGHLEIVRLLLEARADTGRDRSQQSTPLVDACDMGHLDVVRLLLAECRETPMDYPVALVRAFERGHSEIVRFMLQVGHGKGIGLLTDAHLSMLFTQVCRTRRAGHFDMVPGQL